MLEVVEDLVEAAAVEAAVSEIGGFIAVDMVLVESAAAAVVMVVAVGQSKRRYKSICRSTVGIFVQVGAKEILIHAVNVDFPEHGFLAGLQFFKNSIAFASSALLEHRPREMLK